MSPFPEITLHTARLRIRTLLDADAPALMAMYADPEVVRYWSHAPWTELAQVTQMLERDRQARADGMALRLGVEHVAEGRIIGSLSLFNLSPANRRGEIGYALARAYWGQGLMQEALAAFVGYLLGDFALHRLEADVDPRNLASVRSLERLGFQREGYLRERWIGLGELCDTALYGLLASDWPPRR
jgi:RimJ/RimL family protein N-acetyltransferase